MNGAGEDWVTEDAIVDCMIFYGGSFVRTLGRLYLAADDANRLRVVLAFRDYFDEYREIVKARAKQRENGT
jgi:hypothetical protein